MVKTFYPIQTSFSILDYFCQSTTFDDNSCQEELYFTINTLKEIGSIIIVASNENVKEMSNLIPKLQNFFFKALKLKSHFLPYHLKKK